MAQATTIIKTTAAGGKVKITKAAAAVTPATPATPAAVDPMADARAAFAAGMGEAQKTSDRWTSDYSAKMNEHMPAEWWTIVHNDESPEGLKVRKEQKAAYAALRAAGYSNPSVAWKRVRTAAAKLAGWVDAETEEAEEAEEAEEGSAKASPYAKIQELIASAIKKLGKMEADHGGEMKILADVAKRLPSL